MMDVSLMRIKIIKHSFSIGAVGSSEDNNFKVCT